MNETFLSTSKFNDTSESHVESHRRDGGSRRCLTGLTFIAALKSIFDDARSYLVSFFETISAIDNKSTLPYIQYNKTSEHAISFYSLYMNYYYHSISIQSCSKNFLYFTTKIAPSNQIYKEKIVVKPPEMSHSIASFNSSINCQLDNKIIA